MRGGRWRFMDVESRSPPPGSTKGVVPAFRDDLGDKIVAPRVSSARPSIRTPSSNSDPAGTTPATPAARPSARCAGMLGDASTENPDRQGRVTIPGVLRSYAGLDKDCVVIGQGHYLEVWDSATYEAANATDGTTLEDLHDEGVVLL